MIDPLRNMPRYIRNTDAFGWQGADGPDGPWRSITPPQSGAPWQTANPMNDLRQASAEVSGVEVLSPAAQAVLDAFGNTSNGEYIEGVWIVNEQAMLAAALRAAADQGESLYDPHEGKVSVVRVEHLLAIADELEGAQ